MQFSLTDGPPSTWQRYGLDGDHDGTMDVYDPDDAIPAAGNYPRALVRDAYGDIRRAILGYNHSPAYATDVLARARTHAGEVTVATDGCATGIDAPAGPADLRASRRRTHSRRCQHGRWPPATRPSPSTPASPTTCSGSCAATTCA